MPKNSCPDLSSICLSNTTTTSVLDPVGFQRISSESRLLFCLNLNLDLSTPDTRACVNASRAEPIALAELVKGKSSTP